MREFKGGEGRPSPPGEAPDGGTGALGLGALTPPSFHNPLVAAGLWQRSCGGFAKEGGGGGEQGGFLIS